MELAFSVFVLMIVALVTATISGFAFFLLGIDRKADHQTFINAVGRGLYKFLKCVFSVVVGLSFIVLVVYFFVRTVPWAWSNIAPYFTGVSF